MRPSASASWARTLFSRNHIPRCPSGKNWSSGLPMRQLSLLMMLCAGCAQAQSTLEIREILARLQKLEDANRALNEEVTALRGQLAAARGDNPQPEPAEPLQDQLAVEKARVEELSQSKVESAQKLPIRITGMALFNTYVNGHDNGNTENTTIATLNRGDATGGGSLRQSVVGLQFESPRTILGGKASGS